MRAIAKGYNRDTEFHTWLMHLELNARILTSIKCFGIGNEDFGEVVGWKLPPWNAWLPYVVWQLWLQIINLICINCKDPNYCIESNFKFHEEAHSNLGLQHVRDHVGPSLQRIAIYFEVCGACNYKASMIHMCSFPYFIGHLKL